MPPEYVHAGKQKTPLFTGSSLVESWLRGRDLNPRPSGYEPPRSSGFGLNRCNYNLADVLQQGYPCGCPTPPGRVARVNHYPFQGGGSTPRSRRETETDPETLRIRAECEELPPGELRAMAERLRQWVAYVDGVADRMERRRN